MSTLFSMRSASVSPHQHIEERDYFRRLLALSNIRNVITKTCFVLFLSKILLAHLFLLAIDLTAV
jgi:hypothetical protein